MTARINEFLQKKKIPRVRDDKRVTNKGQIITEKLNGIHKWYTNPEKDRNY